MLVIELQIAVVFRLVVWQGIHFRVMMQPPGLCEFNAAKDTATVQKLADGIGLSVDVYDAEDEIDISAVFIWRYTKCNEKHKGQLMLPFYFGGSNGSKIERYHQCGQCCGRIQIESDEYHSQTDDNKLLAKPGN